MPTHSHFTCEPTVGRVGAAASIRGCGTLPGLRPLSCVEFGSYSLVAALPDCPRVTLTSFAHTAVISAPFVARSPPTGMVAVLILQTYAG